MIEEVTKSPSVWAFTSSLANHLSTALKMRVDQPAPTPTAALALFGLPDPVVSTSLRFRQSLDGAVVGVPPYVAFVWQHTTNPASRGCISVSLKTFGFEMRLRRTPTSRVDVVVGDPDATAFIVLLRVYVDPDGLIRGIAPQEEHRAFTVSGTRPTSAYPDIAGMLVEPAEAVPTLPYEEAQALWQDVVTSRAAMFELEALRTELETLRPQLETLRAVESELEALREALRAITHIAAKAVGDVS